MSTLVIPIWAAGTLPAFRLHYGRVKNITFLTLEPRQLKINYLCVSNCWGHSQLCASIFHQVVISVSLFFSFSRLAMSFAFLLAKYQG